MTPVLVAVLGAIWAGAVVAISARDPRGAAVGIAVALVAAALLSDPLPPPALLGSLIVAGLLAAALIRTAAPAVAETTTPGWPAEALLAGAGAIAGLGLVAGLAAAAAALNGGPGGVGGPAVGDLLSVEALSAAGAGALLAVGVGPALDGRPGPRHAVALVLVTQGVLLLREAVAGPATELEVVAWAGLLVAVAAAGAVVARAGATDSAPGRAAVDGPSRR